MRGHIISSVVTLAIALASASVFADEATVNIASEDVQSSNGLLTITASLPANAVGMRLNRAFLEVPVVVNESSNDAFNSFPVLELYQDASELSKQTIVLSRGHTGIVRIDVTRFVRAWSDSEERVFVLGTVSEDNDTAFELGSAPGWPAGTKVRLLVEFVDRDGASISVVE